jgi:nuclear pore complex protein Nup133
MSSVVKVKRQARAITLAEEQRDFRTLVELCHSLAPSETKQKERVYISRYKEEFAFQLYQWYVEHGVWISFWSIELCLGS